MTVELGQRVRAVRTGCGLTLQELASRSGVSRSMISAIERGARVPTVLVLDRIATALGTSLARFARADAEAGPLVLRRAEQSVFVDPGGWERRVLSPVLAGVEFEFMRTTLDPRVDAGVFAPHAAGSREYVAVESGTLRLTLDSTEIALRAGDSAFYPGDCEHGFANHERRRCIYYLAMDLAGQHGAAGNGPGSPERHR